MLGLCFCWGFENLQGCSGVDEGAGAAPWAAQGQAQASELHAARESLSVPCFPLGTESPRPLGHLGRESWLQDAG